MQHPGCISTGAAGCTPGLTLHAHRGVLILASVADVAVWAARHPDAVAAVVDGAAAVVGRVRAVLRILAIAHRVAAVQRHLHTEMARLCTSSLHAMMRP